MKFFPLITLLIPILFGCSSESKDRKNYIQQCMFPYPAIKIPMFAESTCACRYDSIREIYDKPFVNKKLTMEERKKMDYAIGYTAVKCP